jgi:hypothetical protein
VRLTYQSTYENMRVWMNTALGIAVRIYLIAQVGRTATPKHLKGSSSDVSRVGSRYPRPHLQA